MVELHRDALSVYEISAWLRTAGIPLNRTGVGQILSEEGFPRLLRGPPAQASGNPATTGRDTHLPTKVIDFSGLPEPSETALAGLLPAIPDLIALDLPALVAAAATPAPASCPRPAGSWPCSP